MWYVKKGSKEGFTGWKYVIKPNYSCSSKEFDEETNLAVVQSLSNNQWGVINKNGETVIPMEYQEGLDIKKGKIVAKKGGKWGLLDTEGKTLLPFAYDYLEIISAEKNTVLLARKGEKPNGKYGFIDFTGKIIVPVEYDEVRFITLTTSAGSRHYNLKKGGKYGVYGIDEGKFITDVKYDEQVWYTSMNKPLVYKGKIGNDEYEITETGVEKYLGEGKPKTNSASSSSSSSSSKMTAPKKDNPNDKITWTCKYCKSSEVRSRNSGSPRSSGCNGRPTGTLHGWQKQ